MAYHKELGIFDHLDWDRLTEKEKEIVNKFSCLTTKYKKDTVFHIGYSRPGPPDCGYTTKKPENEKTVLSYSDSGVNIETGNTLVQKFGSFACKTRRTEVVSGVGGFAAISSIPTKYEDPLLVSSTDGVGTKVKIASITGNHRTIGIDLVAMSVNDILTVGAEPLFFLDYLAMGKLDSSIAEDVVSGIAEGCLQAGCALIGGETAEMPGMYPPGEYDLSGCVVGVVERKKLIDGQNTQIGDVVIGLPSSGLHSNGYALVRKIFSEDPLKLELYRHELGCSLAEELLRPTTMYVNVIHSLIKFINIRAIAHITGGGLIDNPPRCIPRHLAFRLHTNQWKIPAIMRIIAGKVLVSEMRHTFNMGLGMLVVVPREQVSLALQQPNTLVVGEIVANTGKSVEFY